MVGALITDAKVRYSVAGVAAAVGVEVATLAHHAGRTSATAAVYAGFIAVLDSVRASWGRGCAKTRGAHLASGADHSAPSAVVCIGVRVGLATIGRVIIAIPETGIAGLDGATACQAGSYIIVG
jgi:hypothetical protein